MRIGDKVSFRLFSYEHAACWDTPWGITHLYRFIDSFQNVFIWKTSRILDDNITEVKSAIISGFDEYEGQKEIVLKYCKVA